MVEYQIAVNRKQRVAYVPKILLETFGYDLRLTPDTKAALVYPKGASIPQILASLRHLHDHFVILAGKESSLGLGVEQ
jgi:hypothetical protein